MSLLLRTEPAEQLAREQTSTSHFGVATWAQPLSLSPHFQARQRELVRTAISERKYRQIMDARLGHLPVRLPFPRGDVVNRLKENDRTASNRQGQQKLLEIETELAFLHKSLSSPLRRVKSEVAPKTRRLNAIWDYLSLSASRFQSIFAERVGRLNFNVRVFFCSDLSPRYLVDVGESTQWELAALSIAGNAEAERLVKRLCNRKVDQATKQDFVRAEASFRDIERFYREYLRRLRKITAVSDGVLEWRDALEYYVDLFSADTLSDFRTLRPIAADSLDPSVLDYLSTGLQGALHELREALVAEYPTELRAFSFVPSGDQFVTDLLMSELEAG